jgi:hypothetical protein
MGAVLNLKDNSIFQEIPAGEVEEVYGQIQLRELHIRGVSEDGNQLDFFPDSNQNGYFTLQGSFRSEKKIHSETEFTCHFILEDNKYLFKVIFEKHGVDTGVLHLQTNIYKLKRRLVKRLLVPVDYYALIRLTHVNRKMIRTFGKLANVSPGGMGIILPSDELQIKVGDFLKVVINIKLRPTESVELKVVHKRVHKRVQADGSVIEEVALGALFYPEDEEATKKATNEIVMGIYRDIFGSLLII